MMDSIRFNPIPSPPITPKENKGTPQSVRRFADELQGAISNQNLKVSRHATDRLNQRNIDITDAQWQRVEAKVDEAKSKGIKESLVLLNDAALIVSIKNKTVITAMDKQDMKDHIFSDIDGTIILQD